MVPSYQTTGYSEAIAGGAAAHADQSGTASSRVCALATPRKPLSRQCVRERRGGVSAADGGRALRRGKSKLVPGKNCWCLQTAMQLARCRHEL
jgi:hypothetical protein